MAKFEVKIRFCDPEVKDAEGFKGNSVEIRFGNNPQVDRLEYTTDELDKNLYLDLIEHLMVIEIKFLSHKKEEETEAEECIRKTKLGRVKQHYKDLMSLKALLATTHNLLRSEHQDTLEAALKFKLESADAKLGKDPKRSKQLQNPKQIKELMELIKRA